MNLAKPPDSNNAKKVPDWFYLQSVHEAVQCVRFREIEKDQRLQAIQKQLAVDRLHDLACGCGLYRDHGVDAVQAVIARAFTEVAEQVAKCDCQGERR